MFKDSGDFLQIFGYILVFYFVTITAYFIHCITEKAS